MAQVTDVRLLDDLAHARGDEVPAEGTVHFAIEGHAYEIDLSEENDTKLREVFAPYIRAARRASGPAPRARRQTAVAPRPQPSSSGNTSIVQREENQAIRTWAIAQEMKVAERGRIPSVIVEAYRRAH